MKNLIGTLIAIPALLATAPAAAAQQFAIDWFTIDSGGGSSAGGQFALSGTIGQPDAGDLMVGGPFSLACGFWALPLAVPTPDSPTLYITRAAPGFANISWTATGPGFVLQASDDLETWSDAPSGASNPATVPTSFAPKFYRLRKP